MRPSQRRCDLQIGNPYKLHVFAAFGFSDVPTAFRVEKEVHRRFADKRLIGEWLDVPAQDACDMVIGVCSIRKLGWEKWKHIKPRPEQNGIGRRRRQNAIAEYKRLMADPHAT